MNDATLLRDGDRPILRFERHLPQSVDEVWRVATDPAVMVTWFPTRIELDEWKVGAPLTHHFDEHDIDPLPGVVIEWEPPRRVRFTWADDIISFELSPGPEGGTIFVLTEELGRTRAARNAAGWDSCLDRFEFSQDSETWTSRFERYSAAFTPILGPQEGPPENIHVS